MEWKEGVWGRVVTARMVAANGKGNKKEDKLALGRAGK